MHLEISERKLAQNFEQKRWWLVDKEANNFGVGVGVFQKKNTAIKKNMELLKL